MSETEGIGIFKALVVGAGVVALVAKGVPYLLPAAEEIASVCNRNIQAFDIDTVPVYWKVYEAPCRGNDPNFEIVRRNIELMLVEPENRDPKDWPEAHCLYAQHKSNGYVWGFGTDLEKMAELDCLEPLREMRREKEENGNYLEYMKELVTGNRMVGNQLTNFAMSFL